MAVHHRFTYPFSAIVGQERLKLGLLLNAILPGIGGILIRGERGTGKSTVVRALARLLPEQRVVLHCHYGCNPADRAALCRDCQDRLAAGEDPLAWESRRMRVVELPINASQDRVVGTINLEAALKHGEKRFEAGVLAEANRNLLYVDEVNLLDDHIVDMLLDSAATGINVVEREGVSIIHPAHFILVGTMNPEEGQLRPQLLDRFGLCVDVKGIPDPDLRIEIAERDAAYQRGDTAFSAIYQERDHELATELMQAIAALDQVRFGDRHARMISAICVEANVQGHRADVVTGRAAKALAALRRHPEPTRDDIFDAAELALLHRARTPINREQSQAGEETRADGSHEPAQSEQQQVEVSAGEGAEPSPGQASPIQAGGGKQAAGSEEGAAGDGSSGGEAAPEAAEPFSLRRIELPRKRAPRPQSGKRNATRSPDRRGRYVRAQAHNQVTDLAVDATIRAAAPHQVQRGRLAGERVRLERHDLQQKVRERKVGNLIVFVVDASASMDAEQRMAATKGAILSLLQDAYVRRDRVAVVVFKNRSAEVVLRPTSSVQLAQRRLERLSVGGTTPLTHGLMAGYNIIQAERIRDPSVRPLLVLISDGRGNISMFKEEPLVEAQKVAALISSERFESLVIDSARDFSHLPSVQHLARVAPMYQTYAVNACADLAERMGAQYYGLYDLSRDEIASAIQHRLNR
jgi:magnesium chelatase subunit D